ncbi:MAG: GNAT family N-acetyltransferase [Candidatus Dadabacteria bacterium]|nr:MAG: GNAT family N-acetyltransferase [Candidatus Dadabacteria bacterium]
MNDFNIRQLKDPSSLRGIEKLQKEIWGFSDIAVVPDHLLIALSHISCGAAHVAYYGDKPVGFALSIITQRSASDKIIYSHMLGVVKEFRNRSIATNLKMAQKKYAQENNISKITWTFDPLMTAAARVCFGKLGVKVTGFYKNFYENLRDTLSSDSSTDRFMVEWDSNCSIEKACDLSSIPDCIKWDLLNPAISSDTLNSEAEEIVCSVPLNWHTLKTDNPESATTWRSFTGQVFEKLFASGYTPTDFVCDFENNKGQYLFKKTGQTQR